ncbi:MAG TPA: hypothetical protein VL693_12085 [Vicinamibacterales bacterium]|jgi:hypothetical protein|nr:hypothetical protein [Vicinamibacterales bacterium]
MKKVILSRPMFGFVVATRAALGAGIGLLLSTRVPESRRRALGLTLVSIGAATTIPAVMAIFRGFRQQTAEFPA